MTVSQCKCEDKNVKFKLIINDKAFQQSFPGMLPPIKSKTNWKKMLVQQSRNVFAYESAVKEAGNLD